MNHYQRQMIKEAYEAGYNSINEQKKEVPDNIKTIAGELDKAVKAHTSQAKRLRAAGYDTDEDLPKEVRDIPKELDAAVKMHKSQAERLRKAGLSEAFEAGYRSGLNEQDVYKRPARVSALGGQKFHAIVDSKGVIVAAGLTEKEARKKKKFGQKVMELPGAKVGQVIKKEAYEAGYESGLNEQMPNRAERERRKREKRKAKSRPMPTPVPMPQVESSTTEAYQAGYRSGLNEQEGPTQPPGNPSWPGLLFYLTQVAFGDTTPIALQSVDYNNNGVVDFQDLLRLLNLWSNGYPPQTAQEYIDNTYTVNDREPEPFDVKKISKIISKAAKKNRPSSKLSRRK